jgi:hypothetical protein
VPICVQPFSPSGERSTLKPVSSLERSAQVRLTCVADGAEAASVSGGAGGIGAAGVVVLAVLEYGESPAVL